MKRILCILLFALIWGSTPIASSVPTYDNSVAAKTNFINWWLYEVVAPQDFPYTVDQLYRDGISVCTSRAMNANPDGIMTNLSRDRGYTVSGASAVYKSAVEALCRVHAGYKTDFDRSAERFRESLRSEITFNVQPTIFDYGLFMKETCHARIHLGVERPNLVGHMRTKTQLFLVNSAAGSSDEFMWKMLSPAILSWCIAM